MHRALAARWAIAVRHDGRLTALGNPWDDRWFADPFVVETDKERVVLLVEEYPLQKMKGRIAELTVDRRSLKITGRRTILEQPTQLSFPFIVRREGSRVWFAPESSHAGEMALYSYDRVSGQCRKERVLIEEAVSDGIIWGDYILGTVGQDMNGNRLSVYRLEKDHYRKVATLNFEARVARNAGALFEREGRQYRPAQVCDEWYGEALSLQEAELHGDPRQWTMHEVRRITPPQGFEGIHTLNSLGDVTVVDLKYYPHPWLTKLAYTLLGRTDV